MNKHFVRIFKNLLLSLMAVGFSAYWVVNLVNVVRYEHFLTQISTPVMQWFAATNDHAFALSETVQLPKGVQIPIPERLRLSEVAFSSAETLRLEHGKLVVRDAGGVKELFVYRKGDVWRLRSERPYRDVAWLTVLIISLLPDSEDDVELDGLAQRFGVELSSARENDFSPVSLGPLAEGFPYLYASAFNGRDESQVSALVPLQDGTVMKVEFRPAFDAFSLPLMFFVLLISIAALGGVLYWFVESIDARLRRLDSAATRLARGELGARVGIEEGDAIGRLGASFNTMAEHIQRLVGVQREMIHAVSHELRTPVARIRFGVQMIEDCLDEKSIKKQLVGIDADIQELDELIDEILTYARLEQGGPILTFQEADVKAIVEQVVCEQQVIKPGMTIFAVYSEDSEQWKLSDIEVRYIHRAIQNLVGNATRYASGVVRVSCAFEKDTCRVDVEDDGPGVPESDWERVFTAFSRLDDSRTRSSGGYGLGLSIVRRILYWHGGQAFLGKSELGGARFSLVWPRKQLH